MVRMTCAALLAAAGVATAQSGSLTTLFTGGNGQSGAMFDLTNIGSNPIVITGWDYRLFTTSAVSGTQGIEVYFSLGGYAGKETNPAAWTLLGQTTVSIVPGPTPIHAAIGGLTINPGEKYGIYFTRDNTGSTQSIAYTNGTGSNQVYMNSELLLEAGVGKSYPFGSTFSPRVWNGTVYYDIIPAPGAAALLGLGGLVAIRRRR